jgi:hypothetical protein
MVFDTRRRKVVLFSGAADFGRKGQPAFTDTWEWDGRNRQLVSSTGPTGRILFVMSYDSRRGKVVVFGGNSAYAPPFESGLLGDTWEWDGRRWSQLDVAVPAKRDHHVMVFDRARQRTILYGGVVDGQLVGDTWHFDGIQWAKIETTPPMSLGADAIAFDGRRAKVVTYGG